MGMRAPFTVEEQRMLRSVSGGSAPSQATHALVAGGGPRDHTTILPLSAVPSWLIRVLHEQPDPVDPRLTQCTVRFVGSFESRELAELHAEQLEREDGVLATCYPMSPPPPQPAV